MVTSTGNVGRQISAHLHVWKPLAATVRSAVQALPCVRTLRNKTVCEPYKQCGGRSCGSWLSGFLLNGDLSGLTDGGMMEGGMVEGGRDGGGGRNEAEG